MNFMLHFDGIERDFSEWVRLGATGWSYTSMAKYFDKVQHDVRLASPECSKVTQSTTAYNCYRTKEHIAVVRPHLKFQQF